MRAVVRTLRHRLAALLAVAATVAVAAAFAASLAAAWGPATAAAAGADLHSAPQAAFTVSQYASSAVDLDAAESHLDQAIGRAAPSGTVSLAHFPVSDMDTLPGSSGAAGQRLMTAVGVAGIRPAARLTSGTWPAAPAGGIIPAVVPQPMLAPLGLHVGDRITVTDPRTGTRGTIEISGAYQRGGSDPAYWLWDTAGSSGVADEPGYQLVGPFAVDEAAFGADGLAIDNVTFVVTPAPGTADIGALTRAAARLHEGITADPSAGLVVTDGLSSTLAGLASRIRVDRDQLLVTGALAGVLAGAALLAAGSRLVARGADQAAVLRSRGASRARVVAGFLPDAVVLAGAGAVGVTVWSAWTGKPAGGGAVAAAAAVVAACVLAVGAYAARAGAVDMAAHHQRRRLAPAVLGTGGIAAVACLAAAAAWEARDADLATQADAGVGLVAACAPALAALAGAVLAGRFITAAVRLTGRASLASKRLPAWLAAGEVARTPARYLAAALACVAVIAGGVFALADRASLQRSAADQAAYATGADVAVDLPQPLGPGAAGRIARLPGVIAATPVQRIGEGSTTLLALDPAAAPATVTMRADLADRPPARFWSVLGPARSGLVLPGRPTTVTLTARLSADGATSIQATLTVEDATGLSYQVGAGRLAADGARHTLTAAVAPGGDAAYPLRLIALTLSYRAPPEAAPGRLTIVTIDDGEPGGQHLDAATALAGWSAAARSDLAPIQCNRQALYLGPSISASPSGGADVRFATGAGDNWVDPGDGSCTPQPINATVTVAAGSASTPLPVAATAAYLDQTGLTVGATTTVTLGGIDVPIRIVARAAAFPTIPAAAPSALIAGLATLSGAAASNGITLPGTLTWWLHTAGGAAPAGLPPGTQVSTAAGTRAGLLDDPLARIPLQALSAGVGTLLLLGAAGLLVAIAAAARAAAARDAVLAALGVTRRQRVAIACIGQAAVTVPAAALGAVLGWVLARLLVTSFILDTRGLPPLPVARPVIGVPGAVALAAGVAAVAVLAALAGSLRRSDPAAYTRVGG